jgi:hypothetical protein
MDDLLLSKNSAELNHLIIETEIKEGFDSFRFPACGQGT